jgi:hypothetical protein
MGEVPRMKKLPPALLIAIATIWAFSASAQVNQLHATPYLVTSYGAKCNDVSDDSAAIQAALNTAAATCTYTNGFATYTPVVSFPYGAVCKIRTGLTRSNCVSVEGNQTTLDFSNLSQKGTGMTVVVPTTQSGKSQNGEGGIYVQNLHLNGPGGGSIGIQLNAAGGVYRNVDVYNFGSGIQIGNNAFVHLFDNVSITNYGVAGFSCPAGLSDSGENERWSGGGIYNGFSGAAAIDNQGCEFNGVDLSIDFPSGPFIKNATGSAQSTASTKLTNFHMERNSDPADPAIDMGGGSPTAGACNTWSHVILSDGAILNDSGGTTPNSLAIVRNNAMPCNGQAGQGGWLVINDVQIAGWNAAGPCIVYDSEDMDATCVIGTNAGVVKLTDIADGAGAGEAFLKAGPQ